MRLNIYNKHITDTNHPQTADCEFSKASGGGGSTEGGRFVMPSSHDGRLYTGRGGASVTPLSSEGRVLSSEGRVLSSEGRILARFASHSSRDGSCSFFCCLFLFASVSIRAVDSGYPITNKFILGTKPM